MLSSSKVRRFIPSRYDKESSSVSRTSHSGVDSNLSSPGNEEASRSNISDLSVEEMELWHHYLMVMCPEISDDPASLRFWQINIPRTGFTNHFVLHLTLALSAFHLSRRSPERRYACLAQAEKHETIALQAITPILPCLNSMNCEALYAASTLICFCYLAKGPQPGEFIAFSETGNAQWLILLGGTRSILSSKRAELQSAVFEPMAQESALHEPVKSKRDLVPAYRKPLEELRLYIEGKSSTDEMGARICLRMLDTLASSFRNIYDPISESGLDDRRHSPEVFGWLYRLPDEFCQLLKDKHQAALVILAHFVVILKELDHFWFMKGWAEHVMAGIHSYIGKENEDLIKWPMQQIREIRR